MGLDLNHKLDNGIRGRTFSPSAGCSTITPFLNHRPRREGTILTKVAAILLFTVVSMLLCFAVAGNYRRVAYSSSSPGEGEASGRLRGASAFLRLRTPPWLLSTATAASNSCPVQKPRVDKQGRALVQHYPQPRQFDRAECKCTPVHNFVILSMQRSGSGWFETLLNDHPNITSNGEVFRKWWLRRNFSTIAGTLDSVYNLDWKTSAAKNECTVAVGLKWMLNQGAMEYHKQVGRYFEERDVSIILLLRRNALKRLISILANAHDRVTYQGEHKSHTHSEEEASKLRAFQPTLHVNHLLANLQRVQLIAEDAQRVFNKSRLLKVYYEDVVKDPEGMGNVVLDYLGVPRRRLMSHQVKIHIKPLRDTVANYDEVERTLRGTQYQTFLADGITN